MWLSQTKLHELHAAALSARLDRSALLSGVNGDYAASLKVGGSPSEQLLLDLSAMNNLDELADGSVPLRDWLSNAKVLAGPRKESRVFDEALRLVTKAPGAQITPITPITPAPTTVPFAATSAPAAAAGGAGPSTSAAARAGDVHVFLSVASEDLRFAEALTKHLAPLIRQKWIELRSRKDAPIGANVAEWIAAQLDGADLIVLLVSPDSVADNQTYAEMERALLLRAQGSAVVVPVLVRAASLVATPIAGIAYLPRSGTPISAADDPDAVYAEIASDLGGTIAGIAMRAAMTPVRDMR